MTTDKPVPGWAKAVALVLAVIVGWAVLVLLLGLAIVATQAVWGLVT